MPELTAMEKPKIAGFVDRGFNHAKKQKQMEEAEAEIARLEAEARGETVEEQEESSSEDTENTEVQASDDSKQEETTEETKAQEDDDSELDAEEKYMNEIRNAAFKAMLNTNITRGDKIE